MEKYKAGTKFVVHVDAGICGTDSTEFYILSDDMTEDELNDYAWECATNHAESYGIYPASEYCDEETDEQDQNSDSYSENIEGYFELYDSEKHDGKSIGGIPIFHKV